MADFCPECACLRLIGFRFRIAGKFAIGHSLCPVFLPIQSPHLRSINLNFLRAVVLRPQNETGVAIAAGSAAVSGVRVPRQPAAREQPQFLSSRAHLIAPRPPSKRPSRFPGADRDVTNVRFQPRKHPNANKFRAVLGAILRNGRKQVSRPRVYGTARPNA
jgi:hypothetical protein